MFKKNDSASQQNPIPCRNQWQWNHPTCRRSKSNYGECGYDGVASGYNSFKLWVLYLWFGRKLSFNVHENTLWSACSMTSPKRQNVEWTGIIMLIGIECTACVQLCSSKTSEISIIIVYPAVSQLVTPALLSYRPVDTWKNHPGLWATAALFAEPDWQMDRPKFQLPDSIQLPIPIPIQYSTVHYRL